MNLYLSMLWNTHQVLWYFSNPDLNVVAHPLNFFQTLLENFNFAIEPRIAQNSI